MITSSIVLMDQIQRDGRRQIVEIHTDHTGATHRVEFLAESSWNASGYLPTRAAQIETRLQEAETEANLAEIESG